MARINTNVSSLTAQRGLSRSQKTLNETLQRLSSGLKINTGKDAVVQTIATKPWPEASVGYEPDGVALTDDGHLLVTLGRADEAIAAIDEVSIVFTPGGVPSHLYPHTDASLPHVNKQREYQAVNGACLLIGRDLFQACKGFDEGYRNGYEDVDLCLEVRAHGRKVVCCTSAFISSGTAVV